VTCPTERLEYCPKDGWTCSKKYFEERVLALEAELEKANQLAIKLALQKGQRVDEIRGMRSRLAEAKKLAKRIFKEIDEKSPAVPLKKDEWTSYHKWLIKNFELHEKLRKSLREEAGK